ncbi:hypothetical protein GUITHDRAFT_155584 [Guillardia theta CCMP2712]|uniref:Uncharacterized protein n=1 Tax=Guillardia theta (strain CCMP2712) TaxID=905079 RepID=L1IFQ3_GUITC|nr:hypothetical protein GUITHDRAFT_155584 [Guillardia theta CCMP2712]EKX35091.1 hypothetical protein GUITHDRAFT_155584 [Guillardia theta CCMP2712]|eukprot:XP_005822071.1 hypothetical protein GUITHDRAFT_155584 [Guillardia theta CCMP2712]
MIFALVPLSALGAGPEITNNMYAPHNCVGGSETSCLPSPGELSGMFADPSKAGMGYTVPAPSHWYRGTAAFL